MTATAHALIAGAIATSISDPLIGISLSAISHPLMDMVPHWDLGWGWRQKSKQRLFLEAVADTVLALALTYMIFGWTVDRWYLLACIIASISWDLAEIPYWFWKWDFPPFSWVYQFQHEIQGKARLPWGIISQIAAFAIIFIALQYYKF